MAYLREQWSSLFTVLDVDLLLNDPYQVVGDSAASAQRRLTAVG